VGEAYLLVRRHNTLSGIAAGLLRTQDVGSEGVHALVGELVGGNLGAVQADGRYLADPDEIEVGWWLRLPSRFEMEPGGYLLVEHGDNAWDLSEECLGGPNDRHELIRLNLGRPQPDGRQLQDGNYLYEGWLLRVPDRFVRPTVDRSVPAGPGEPSSAERSLPQQQPVLVPLDVNSSPTEDSSPPGTASGNEPAPATGESGEYGGPRGGVAIELPSGAVVGASFVSGALAVVALGRLKRRRQWIPVEPVPGLGAPSTSDEPVLLLPTAYDDDGERIPAGTGVVQVPHLPGEIEVGHRGNEAIRLDVLRCGGLVVDGPAAEGCVRAMALAALVRDGKEEWTVLVTGLVAPTPLGTEAASARLRVSATESETLTWAEVELVHRARLFEREGVDTFGEYTASDPDEMLPNVLVILDRPQDGARARAIAIQGSDRGVAVVSVGPWEGASSRIVVDAAGTVLGDGSGILDGASLYHATAAEAVPVVTAVAATVEADPAPSRAPARLPSEDVIPPQPVAPPVTVRLFGGFDVSALGEEVLGGLRSTARELLAMTVLRPGGVTIEGAIDKMWPTADPEKARDWFKKALANLRKRLRDATGLPELDVIKSLGEGRYRAVDTDLDADVWRFERALEEAVAARGDAETEEVALARALAEYQGELLDGFLYEWVEPIRADFRSRALDVVARLAGFYVGTGRPEDALAVLRRGIEVDEFAEELYAHGIRILCELGRSDTARRLLDRLEERLAEIGEEPLPTTEAPLARLLASRARRAEVNARPTGSSTH
jgi:DNA-binding SARP family transcriptional activator